ncbi:MAG: hypothetical protein RIC95_09555 [Vicingaceae bacterium]
MKKVDEKVSQNGSAKNGTATAKEVAKTSESPRKRIPSKEKKPVATTPKKKEEDKSINFQKRKEKFNTMYELSKKHDKLKATQQKLKELLTPKDPVNNNLTLYIREGGSTGNYVADSDFRTSNSLIVLHALHFLSSKVDEYLQSLEEDILETTI